MNERTPHVVAALDDLTAARDALPGPVGVVMTMGALHEGHATLVRQARKENASVVVTIFVNPLQFGDGEDLDNYPRTLDADLAILAREGADLVFTPSEKLLYPDGDALIRVSAGTLGSTLEGAHRPGHFDGMLTVVNKLMNLTRPDVAYYGQKDAQQLLLIKRMVADLNMATTVTAVPTVRDDDGLALSSRNTYLSADERRTALCLSRALRAGESVVTQGADAVREAAHKILAAEPGFRPDYLALVSPNTFEHVPSEYQGEALLAIAGHVGTTRLIDNMPLTVGA